MDSPLGPMWQEMSPTELMEHTPPASGVATPVAPATRVAIRPRHGPPQHQGLVAFESMALQEVGRAYGRRHLGQESASDRACVRLSADESDRKTDWGANGFYDPTDFRPIRRTLPHKRTRTTVNKSRFWMTSPVERLSQP